MPGFVSEPSTPRGEIQWERWQNPESEEWLETFTIVTTNANELMRPIHERMPLKHLTPA